VEQRFKILILQDYLNLVLYKDLIERYEIRNQALLKYLLKFLLSNNANPFSINKFFQDIRSQGFKVSKDSIFNYLSYLEEAFWFSLVPLFSESIRKRQVNYRKIYVLDNGLISANRSTLFFNRGRLLESLVFQQLRRKYKNNRIFYYRTAKNEEIDFLIIDDKQPILIQVAESINDLATKQRERNALFRAMQELNLSYGLIITAHEYAEFEQTDLKIQVLPYWEWALTNVY
jgi:predicted AAA+ superfamily ATPase